MIVSRVSLAAIDATLNLLLALIELCVTGRFFCTDCAYDEYHGLKGNEWAGMMYHSMTSVSS